VPSQGHCVLLSAYHIMMLTLMESCDQWTTMRLTPPSWSRVNDESCQRLSLLYCILGRNFQASALERLYPFKTP